MQGKDKAMVVIVVKEMLVKEKEMLEKDDEEMLEKERIMGE